MANHKPLRPQFDSKTLLVSLNGLSCREAPYTAGLMHCANPYTAGLLHHTNPYASGLPHHAGPCGIASIGLANSLIKPSSTPVLRILLYYAIYISSHSSRTRTYTHYKYQTSTY
ncbi:hypothetical protein HAX54_025170 [Datura stramonium]|uniref:Uncharacterized protein n=1 Tax=Datura stramonium TaxID=4076 RepID=A0ABS8UZC3_DATST|nr:hypothetical protein [Datura stramonium]